ncbi:MAG: family 20 glycosylhydrolase [Candidatus Eremiobacteraeota bacterium]|nr:family 20 glycosylhydrolase [Candidatus Eremiobacteraeota bacterium]
MPKRLPALLLLPAFLSACAGGAVESHSKISRSVVSIVPQPVSLALPNGGAYVWRQTVNIEARDSAARNAAGFLMDFLWLHHVQSRTGAPKSSVVLRRLPRPEQKLGTEGYRLTVNPSGVAITANTGAGLFYGVQTLEQLSRLQDQKLVSAPAVVFDRPEYAWRGIHLDVSRHFFEVAVVERYIDIAAHYKLNIFHWHLTDDQAWRLEIKRYPHLTGAGPYYTQAQIGEVVRYAALRHVTVVPEIEIPAHSTAARRAYSYTAAFVENVLTEVMTMFPGHYVHIGGDEAVYSAAPAAMMREVQRFLSVHGRRAVGWDDVLAAHPAKSMLIMSWHGEKRALHALALGYDVVVSPDGPLYFDAYQGARVQEPLAAPHMSTLEQVYAFNPQPDRAAGRVYGAQANVWTERVRTPDHLFYMVFPRELALAEIVWDPPGRKNWDRFLERLPAQLSALEERGYAFRPPSVLFSVQAPHIAFAPVAGDPQAAQALTDAQSVSVRLRGMGDVYYSTDGSVPGLSAIRYTGPFTAKVPRTGSLTLRAIAFLSAHRHSGVTTCVLTRTTRGLTNAKYSRTWAGLVSP